MKTKLKKFTTFAAALMPHELDYLLATHQFQDEENIQILKRIKHNCLHITHPLRFDEAIDKRKYSNLKKWIQDRLKAINVDEQYDGLTDLDKKVITDALSGEEEKQIFTLIRKYEKPHFHFVRLYEMLQHFRQYLLIRLRYGDHQRIDHFLQTQAATYQRSKAVFEQLHRATEDIVGQYARNSVDPHKWEEWLIDLLHDEELDGHNRMLAFVRLSFMYIHYQELDKLKVQYEYLDAGFKQGKHYSPRLLANYYANRLILHAKLGELPQAAWYGKLSLRFKNPEYLFYVTNLAAVMLRQGKPQETLQLMKESFPYLKRSSNYHQKTGFVAFYLRSLNACGQAPNAEKYAETFIRSYKEHLFLQRWHNFFTAYLQALLMQEKYSKVLRVAQRFSLIDRDKKYQRKASYLPTIRWYLAVASYKEAEINETELQALLEQTTQTLLHDAHKLRLLLDLTDELKVHFPSLFLSLQSDLSNYVDKNLHVSPLLEANAE